MFKKRFFLLLTAILSVAFIAICIIGCVKKEKDSNWYITNYADASGNQGMFYTIYNEAQDTLIVVDGGWTENTDQVRKTIASLGDHVNAWIVTHYHNDHVDALNNILAEPKNIQIDIIYDSSMDYEQYLDVAQSWDTPDSFTRYKEVTAEMENIHHVQRDEVITISGLTFRFYNTYDNLTASVSDIPNNACLVFKVSGNSESMLFMADCHSNEMANLLIDRYGNDLKANYIQSPHHGNAGNSKTICQFVSPSVIFMDAPQWLAESEQHLTKSLIAWAKENNIQYNTFMDAPNQIILK